MRFFPLIHMRRCGFPDKFGRTIRVGVILVGASVVLPGLARADDFTSHPIDSMLKAFDLKTDVAPAPDFVQASRPKSESEFLPVGAPHPERSVKVKTPAELKAAEAQLDAARIHQDKLAGRKPPPATPVAAKKPPKSAAAGQATQN